MYCVARFWLVWRQKQGERGLENESEESERKIEGDREMEKKSENK